MSEEAESSAREWLRFVYGEDVAVEAMRLPWELRVQLYPEVLRLGPCGGSVQEFFDTVVGAGGRTSLHLAFSDMWVELVKVYKDDLFLSRGTTKDNFLYHVLRESVVERFSASHGYGVVECITVVSLGLSAEWVGVEARGELADFLVEMNAVLAAVKLPALQGVIGEGNAVA